jgi:hypothetical protein
MQIGDSSVNIWCLINKNFKINEYDIAKVRGECMITTRPETYFAQLKDGWVDMTNESVTKEDLVDVITALTMSLTDKVDLICDINNILEVQSDDIALDSICDALDNHGELFDRDDFTNDPEKEEPFEIHTMGFSIQ